jgi:DMSO/TMAO reductase YedYZ molybdopterin-dependent catalytic subunit
MSLFTRPFRAADRREFLRGAGLAALPFLFGGRLLGDAPDGPKLLVRQADPVNLEFPFDSLSSFLTPNELFYVRNHFAAPALKEADWSLEVVGAVAKPLKLSYRDLTAGTDLKATKLPVTLECAGNGRSVLVPKAKGVPWELGAVSTAEWTGVTLDAVLTKAQVKPGAVEVVLEGADRAEVLNDPKPIGPINFARGLPLEKARKPEVLLAFRMNGQALPPAHGFPLRAVVAGWYGMASVKWLRRIVVTERPFRGYWQTTDYSVWETRDGLPVQVPITEMEVKASIARPAAGEVLPAGKAVRVHGAAWAGGAAVTKVEVSADGGKSWAAAKLLDRPVPWCWRLWEYTWEPAAGTHVLLARARDDRGRVQPLTRDPDRRNYVVSHCVPTEVTVR